MRSCITHFTWPDAGLCEVPSKPILARAKGVGRYMCVFLCKCVRICTHANVCPCKCVSNDLFILKKNLLSIYSLFFLF